MTTKKITAILLLLPSLSLAQTGQNNEDSLKRAALYLDPVEITAIRATENSPFTKTSITKKDLRQSNLGQDFPYLLNHTPSVVINSDAGNGVGYTGIRIRGSDATRINMTINGIPYNDAESQGLFFVNLPDLASSVNDVQIQRGIGTSSNGAGAFGASMNFSTNEVNTKAYADINNSFGSFNTWKHTVRAGSGLISDHFTVDARLSKISSDGFVDRARTDLGSFYISGAYLTENSSLRLNVFSGKEKTYQAWNGIPASDLVNNRRANYSGTEKPGTPYDDETDNYQQDHYQLFFNHRFSEKLSFNTGVFLTRGKGYYENYKADQSFADYGLNDFTVGSDTLTTTDLVRQLWLDNYYYGQIFSIQHKSESSTVTFGGGWNRYDGDHYGKVIWAEQGFPINHRWYDLDAFKTDVNVYAKYQQKISTNFDLWGDLQYRRVHYVLNGFRNNPDLFVDNIYHFVNPKLGVTYAFRGTRLYASYAYASKEPNRDDFEAGVSQQPKPERMHDIELGVVNNFHKGSWGVTLYYMAYKDQLVPTGRINDVGASTRFNIPRSFRTGIELQGGTEINQWIGVSGNLTLSKNKVHNLTAYYDNYDDESGQKTEFYPSADIAFSPEIVAAAAVNIVPFKHATISLPAKYISRQYLDNTSNKERSLAGYYLQDVRFSYQVPMKLFRETNLILQVNNIFDKKYEANGYTYAYYSGGQMMTENYYFPQAGTNWVFAVNIGL